MLMNSHQNMSSVRSWQCTEAIATLKNSLLKHPFISTFMHDITYGKGQISILSDSKDWIEFYVTNQLPLFFTDESGRILPEGVYVTNTLLKTEDEKNRFDSLKQRFNFSYSLIIVKHEGDIQHTYSVKLNCNENQLIFFLANKLPYIQRFIAVYERQCKDAIDFVKNEKRHLICPYGSGDTSSLAELLQTYLVDEETLENQALHVPHALNHQLVNLSDQQSRCLQLLLKGKAAKVIAQQMNLSHRTIEHYTAHIYKRLGIHNSGELISHYSYLVQ